MSFRFSAGHCATGDCGCTEPITCFCYTASNQPATLHATFTGPALAPLSVTLNRVGDCLWVSGCTFATIFASSWIVKLGNDPILAFPTVQSFSSTAPPCSHSIGVSDLTITSLTCNPMVLTGTLSASTFVKYTNVVITE